MQSHAQGVAAYIEEAPADRKEALTKLRRKRRFEYRANDFRRKMSPSCATKTSTTARQNQQTSPSIQRGFHAGHIIRRAELPKQFRRPP